MERIALQKFIDWNESKKKKPLIVWGARQVGKTYLIKDIFAETYYKKITAIIPNKNCLPYRFTSSRS